jgi:hypothetical protein
MHFYLTGFPESFLSTHSSVVGKKVKVNAILGLHIPGDDGGGDDDGDDLGYKMKSTIWFLVPPTWY